MTETKPTVSWFLSVSVYVGRCALCDKEVAAGDGFRQKNRATQKWETLCEPCVREHGRVTPCVYSYGGEVRVATAQSVVTRKGHQVLECNRCRGKVAWVKSSKSGKFYLANVFAKMKMEPDSADGLRVYDFRSHDCEPRLKMLAEERARLEAEDAARTELRRRAVADADVMREFLASDEAKDADPVVVRVAEEVVAEGERVAREDADEADR